MLAGRLTRDVNAARASRATVAHALHHLLSFEDLLLFCSCAITSSQLSPCASTWKNMPLHLPTVTRRA